MQPKSLVFLVTLLSFCFISNAQVLKWASKIGGNSTDKGNRSIVDVNGNLYVVGSFQGANVDFDPGPGTSVLNSSGLKDGFIAKYDQYGVFKWAFKIGGTSQDDIEDVSVDNAGNIVIAGYFRGSNVDFNPSSASAFLSSNGENGGDPGYGGDIFVAKYDTLGNYKWAFNIGGSSIADDATSVSVDLNDNILITGYFQGLVDFDPSASISNLNSSSGIIYVAKFNSNGNYLWAINTGQGFSDNAGFKVIADNQNNVLVTGFFQGSNIDFDPSLTGSATLTSNGGFDYFIAKYNSNGQYLWAKNAGGSGTDVGRSIAIDAFNDIYVTGDFNSATINFNNGSPANTFPNKGGNDLFLVKYASNGQHLWSFATGGSGNEFGFGIFKDVQNNVIITRSTNPE